MILNNSFAISFHDTLRMQNLEASEIYQTVLYKNTTSSLVPVDNQMKAVVTTLLLKLVSLDSTLGAEALVK